MSHFYGTTAKFVIDNTMTFAAKKSGRKIEKKLQHFKILTQVTSLQKPNSFWVGRCLNKLN